MFKTKIITIVSSLALTAVVASLFGLAGRTIIGTFWGWFWISTLIQFLGFMIANSYLIQKDQIALQKAENEALEYLSKFTIKLVCSYCQQTNLVPIQLNQRNSFKCEGCNQVNGVSMQFMATSLTTPIKSVNIPVVDQQPVEIKLS
jgi:hypothetical protein